MLSETIPPRPRTASIGQARSLSCYPLVKQGLGLVAFRTVGA